MALRTRHMLEISLPEGGALPVSEESKDAVLNRYMAQHGLKSTRQRSLIIDTFFSVGGHLSVEELWSKVREQDTKVSVATVYRTMKLLNDCGLAHARNFGDGQTRYEAAAGREHHDHLICTRCGRIVEFENDRIEAMQDAVAKKHGFIVTSHKMELYGLCKDCQRAATERSKTEA
jgi:Fur family ferric uptake transcriptional regulator